LRFKKWKVQVWQDKIFVNDGLNRSQVALPAAGDSIEWQQVELLSLHGQLFLQMEYWGAPIGDAEVSQRHWLVYELADAKAKLLWNEIVQRRKVLKRDPPKKNKTENDKEIPHKIYLKKNKILKKLGRMDEPIHQEKTK
jgi:hypothetical protein